MQQNSFFKQILQQVPSLLPNYCDKCGARHEIGDLQIIKQDMSKVICRLGCNSCNNSYLIHINIPLDGIVTAKRTSFVSDITKEEFQKFSELQKINNEEVLEVFVALKEVSEMKDLEYLLLRD